MARTVSQGRFQLVKPASSGIKGFLCGAQKSLDATGYAAYVCCDCEERSQHKV